jgi:hypothetical protein
VVAFYDPRPEPTPESGLNKPYGYTLEVSEVLFASDPIHMWAAVLLGIGVAVLYRRRAGPFAVGFLGLYFTVVAVIVLEAVLTYETPP